MMPAPVEKPMASAVKSIVSGAHVPTAESACCEMRLPTMTESAVL